mgnify:CR=1 FL=1
MNETTIADQDRTSIDASAARRGSIRNNITNEKTMKGIIELKGRADTPRRAAPTAASTFQRYRIRVCAVLKMMLLRTHI